MGQDFGEETPKPNPEHIAGERIRRDANFRNYIEWLKPNLGPYIDKYNALESQYQTNKNALLRIYGKDSTNEIAITTRGDEHMRDISGDHGIKGLQDLYKLDDKTFDAKSKLGNVAFKGEKKFGLDLTPDEVEMAISYVKSHRHSSIEDKTIESPKIIVPPQVLHNLSQHSSPVKQIVSTSHTHGDNPFSKALQSLEHGVEYFEEHGLHIHKHSNPAKEKDPKDFSHSPTDLFQKKELPHDKGLVK